LPFSHVPFRGLQSLLENADLFHVSDENFTGRPGAIVQVEGLLFRAIHEVGIGQNTKPAETPSMWIQISNPTEEFCMDSTYRSS